MSDGCVVESACFCLLGPKPCHGFEVPVPPLFRDSLSVCAVIITPGLQLRYVTEQKNTKQDRRALFLMLRTSQADQHLKGYAGWNSLHAQLLTAQQMEPEGVPIS